MQETRARILEEISAGPVSGPQLAERLGVSRAAVWKHVEALRRDGFTVESTDAGYEVSDVPEFCGPAVAFGLDAPYEVEYHDSIDSTNSRARALAAQGAENVVVLADEQTGGKGCLDREWLSPSGGIWLSILVRPAVPPTHAPAYTLAASAGGFERSAGLFAVDRKRSFAVERASASRSRASATPSSSSSHSRWSNSSPARYIPTPTAAPT